MKKRKKESMALLSTSIVFVDNLQQLVLSFHCVGTGD